MNRRSEFSLIIVTGLSGGGKSTALKVFEDLGYFCVDGLPVSMLPKMMELFQSQDFNHRGLVLGMDLRQADFADEWAAAHKELSKQGIQVQILFLESSLDTLVRRYATTRRLHPLESKRIGLEQALEQERELMRPVRALAELVIDTTMYSVHDLRRMIQDKWAAMEAQNTGMRVHLITFGFKYGVPLEADLVYDLRFLPNPYFDKELRPMSGKDAPVADYVLGSDPGLTFKNKFIDFLKYMLPLYADEGRYRVTIGIGCTGGRHRSVATAEAVFAALGESGYATTLEHRHLELG